MRETEGGRLVATGLSRVLFKVGCSRKVGLFGETPLHYLDWKLRLLILNLNLNLYG